MNKLDYAKRVLHAAQGGPLHIKEIAERAIDLGMEHDIRPRKRKDGTYKTPQPEVHDPVKLRYLQVKHAASALVQAIRRDIKLCGDTSTFVCMRKGRYALRS
jgi:hypothetical protein